MDNQTKEQIAKEVRQKQIERHNALIKRAKELMAQGYTSKEIASFLKLKESVVRVLESESLE